MDLLGNLKRSSEEIDEEKEQFKFFTQMLYWNKKITLMPSSSVCFKHNRNNLLDAIYLQAQ